MDSLAFWRSPSTKSNCQSLASGPISLLKISICRYKGPDPLDKGNLVLIGHNYKSGAHFGILKKLEVGDEVYLTNAATSARVRYEVYQIKSISADCVQRAEVV